MKHVVPIRAYPRSVTRVLPDPVDVETLPPERLDLLEPIGKILPELNDAELDLGPLKALAHAVSTHPVHGGAKTDAERNAVDAWIAPRLHSALRISRRLAAQDGFWTWLALEHAAPLVAHRFANPDGTIPRWRFIGAAFRNALSRLWWGAELARNGPDYAAVQHVFGRTRTAQFALELAYSQYRPAAIAFALVAEGVDGGPRLNDAHVNALSTTANVRLTLRALEAGETEMTQSLRDETWWTTTPVLQEVTADTMPRGPNDGFVSPAVIDHLVDWFRSLSEAPETSADDGLESDREAPVEASKDSMTPDVADETDEADEDEASQTQDEDGAARDHADLYVELGLPDEWRPILEPFRRTEASPPQHETCSHAVIDELLAEGLNERLQFIMTERFVRGRTLEEVGQALGLTRERVRQLEAKALGRLRHMDAKRPFEDDDLRAHISNLEVRPLFLAHDDAMEAALRSYLAWSKKSEIRIDRSPGGLVVTSLTLNEDLDKVERYVMESREFTTLSQIEAALSLSDDVVEIIVELSEHLYLTENGHVGSTKWTKYRQLEVAAWTLALSELEVTHWHASELYEAARILFPESLAKWRARNAFSTISNTDGDAFVHTGQRGTWALREAIAGPATTTTAVEAFLASKGPSDASDIMTHLEHLGRLVRRGTLDALLQREPQFVRTDEGAWTLREDS